MKALILSLIALTLAGCDLNSQESTDKIILRTAAAQYANNAAYSNGCASGYFTAAPELKQNPIAIIKVLQFCSGKGDSWVNRTSHWQSSTPASAFMTGCIDAYTDAKEFPKSEQEGQGLLLACGAERSKYFQAEAALAAKK